MSTELARLLKSRKATDRLNVLPKIMRLPVAERLPLLLEALQDRLNYVATLAAEALGEIADGPALAKMLERFTYLMEDGLERDPGCHIRAHLAFAFGRQEYHWAVDALRAGIRARQIEAVGGVPFDTAAHLRANCALALAQMHAPDAVRDISLLLFDMSGNALASSAKDATVRMEPRKAAAQALARLGDIAGRIPLALKLAYPEKEAPEVLQECMQAAVELEDPRALELLTPYLRHSDDHLAAFTALMVARTRDPEAPRLLQETALRLTGNPLLGVVLALTTLRTETARQALYALAEEAREAVPLAVIEALRDSPEPSDEPVLQRLAAQSRSPKIRNAAQQALEER